MSSSLPTTKKGIHTRHFPHDRVNAIHNLSHDEKNFKKQKGKFFKVLLGFLVVGFFASISIAFAAIPGLIPSAPATGNDACFVAHAAGSPNDTYCYSTFATCKTNEALVISPAKLDVPCTDNYSKQPWVSKKFFAGSPVGAAIDTISNFSVGGILLSPIVLLAAIFFKVAGLFLAGMGTLLDLAISSTINSDFYTGLTVIDISWTAVRDFSNMFFIFALLFIAIKTILGLAGSDTKRWVAHLIIAALLINFSLFATKVVIDAGNAIAWGFWDQMTITAGGISGQSATMNLLEGFKLQSVADPKDSSGKPISLDATTKIMIYLGGGLLMFVAGYVFLAGAIMMIVRTVTLIILMIISPFAFLGFALPVGGGFAKTWMTKLVGSTFVAPAFIAMLYLVSTIINSPDLFKLTNGQNKSIGGALAGDISSYAIIYNYVLLIILILAALTVANAVSAGAGDKAGSWAKKGLGYGAIAGAIGVGVAGRQLGGRVGKMTAESKKLREMAESGSRTQRFFANAALKTGEVAKKGTWDVRNANVMGYGVGSALGAAGIKTGQGSKRSFDTHGSVLSGTPAAALVAGGAALATRGAEKVLPEGKALNAVRASRDAVRDSVTYRGAEDEAAILKTAEERYKLNPVAKEKYLRDKLGPQYDAPRYKETRDKISSEVAVKEKKDVVVAGIDQEKGIKEQLEKGTITKEVAETTLKTIADTIGSAMGKIPPNEIAKMFSLYGASGAFTSNLNKQALHAVHQQLYDGKYDTLRDSKGAPLDSVSDHITQSIMSGNNEDAKKYLMSTEGQKRLFNFNVEKYAKAEEAVAKSKEFQDKFTVAGSSYGKKA